MTDDQREAAKRRIRETIPPFRDPDVVPTKAEAERDEAWANGERGAW